MATQIERQRPPRIELTVVRTHRLAPEMVRVVLGGPGFDDFVTNGFTDKYVKLVFGEVTRTYTVRSVDPEAREIAVDFVVHGDSGIAAPWAAAARPGDTLSLAGPGGGYAPDPAADAHVFAGDASALPAIAAALEALPATARGFAYLEAEKQALDAPAGVEVHWIGPAAADYDPARLAGALAASSWPDGVVQVFVHGERESVKALRRVLADRGVPRERLSISGYWAFGRTEDRFQAEKREPIGRIED